MNDNTKKTVPRWKQSGAIASETLQKHRNELAHALLETAHLVPRFAKQIREAEDGGTAIGQREHFCLVDYLASWLCDDSNTYRALYLGERVKMAYDASHTVAERNAMTRSLLESDARVFARVLQREPAYVCETVADAFAKMIKRVPAPGAREVRVLFVGDCLHLDVMAFLTDALGSQNIATLPYFVTDKNPVGAASAIQELSCDDFDLVFYSPFTYENGLSFSSLFQMRNSFISENQRNLMVKVLLEEVSIVAKSLAEFFSIPIFIHNTVAIPRYEKGIKQSIRRYASKRARRKISYEIDKGIESIISALNDETFPHLHKIDELKFLKYYTETELGRFLYRFGLQHPAQLGKVIAEDYALIIETVAILNSKKMVICDLDNTLWEGVIGEGKVKHYIERQELLKRLKSKGVVLAIASKNNPENINWDGGILCENDFVFSQISWEQKITAFKNIELSLNLKHKDFVFIDDRADERAMAEEHYPKMAVLNAENSRTWEMLSFWEQMLDPATDIDRTQMYLDRAKRQAFQTKNEVFAEDKATLFSKLGLNLTINSLQKKDIKRA
ncbi:MAG: HAD-IIIC family phosphatase, partial [Cyanobacteria bacterium P01_F01_bin.53]